MLAQTYNRVRLSVSPRTHQLKADPGSCGSSEQQAQDETEGERGSMQAHLRQPQHGIATRLLQLLWSARPCSSVCTDIVSKQCRHISERSAAQDAVDAERVPRVAAWHARGRGRRVRLPRVMHQQLDRREAQRTEDARNALRIEGLHRRGRQNKEI